MRAELNDGKRKLSEGLSTGIEGFADFSDKDPQP